MLTVSWQTHTLTHIYIYNVNSNTLVFNLSLQIMYNNIILYRYCHSDPKYSYLLQYFDMGADNNCIIIIWYTRDLYT